MKEEKDVVTGDSGNKAEKHRNKRRKLLKSATVAGGCRRVGASGLDPTHHQENHTTCPCGNHLCREQYFY